MKEIGNSKGSESSKDIRGRLFTECAQQDMDMLAAIINDYLNAFDCNRDFSIKDYTKIYAEKFGVDEELIFEMALMYFLYLERIGGFSNGR